MRYRGVLGEQRLMTDANGEVAVKLLGARHVLAQRGLPGSHRKGMPPADGPANVRRYSYAATLEILPE
ncbi:hypothetical protein LP420_32245 [Massilia sp. B-10]|nr:hypothetical protein LP420_32245 [Massilia sp. B-10]